MGQLSRARRVGASGFHGKETTKAVNSPGQDLTSLRSYVAVHPKSRVTHQPNRVFTDAKKGRVLLQERGGENYVLVAESLIEPIWLGNAEVAKVLALTQASPESYPELPEYAWTASLSLEARVRLRDDLVLALRRALEEDDWPTYGAELESWRMTAGVQSDAEVAADLLADWNRAEEIPLRRP